MQMLLSVANQLKTWWIYIFIHENLINLSESLINLSASNDVSMYSQGYFE